MDSRGDQNQSFLHIGSKASLYRGRSVLQRRLLGLHSESARVRQAIKELHPVL